MSVKPPGNSEATSTLMMLSMSWALTKKTCVDARQRASRGRGSFLLPIGAARTSRVRGLKLGRDLCKTSRRYCHVRRCVRGDAIAATHVWS